ncbi:MAG: right-handed parallel beta-helix repeat-containing protein [Candidatus Eisenbacteria sp.]|nr:right-handed parallel beta-helix repeat-containing protein [Candidatus Eisenbacteria bacterium]
MTCKLLAVLLVLSAPWAACATTYLVLPDGSGDFPTIQEAIVAAADGDLILLGNGTFVGDGNRDINFAGKAITVRSKADDPSVCTIDCQGSPGNPHRGFYFSSDETRASVICGITIVNGWLEGSDWEDGTGAGIFCSWGDPTIENCAFIGNSARSGGGVACNGFTGPAIIDCLFEGNVARVTGNGAGLLLGASIGVVVSGCVFRDNDPSGMSSSGSGPEIRDCEFSGHTRFALNCTTNYDPFPIEDCRFFDNTGPAIRSLDAQPNISRCSFRNNRAANGAAFLLDIDFAGTIRECLIVSNIAEDSGGAVWCRSGTPGFVNCTFAYNEAGGGAGGIECVSGTATLENTIIAFSTAGQAISGNANLSCCDLYGNAGGDWVGDIAGQFGLGGNISENPLFCDPMSDDFTLQADSPCAPFSSPNPECDLIGSEPIGCQPPTGVWPPAGITSWGGVKALFREGRD